MPYYRKCPDCGARLDPQEPCDCQTKVGDVPLQRKRPQVEHGFFNGLYTGYGPDVKNIERYSNAK